MGNARLLVIQPDDTDPPGALGEWLTEAGAELDVLRPHAERLPDDLTEHRGVVCLGGGMNAEDDVHHPWLAGVRRLLGTAAGTGVPTLGVCLGAQLLAVATGGTVRRGAHGPEVGPALVAKKDAAWVDPLFAELPLMPDVLQFHQDAIDRLPPGAELLASAPTYPHQAFRLSRCAYGLQFHIETTPEMVLGWAADAPAMAEHARPGTLDHDALAAAHADIAETWRPFAHRFVRLADGSLAPAGAVRPGLPLA
ncbi:GMP synthase-Glutamine amidotransferase [Amycolatopsis arida]|uniref:GMP synthase-Glutamine amidotransferase n=1 Tax=Amycolatopsis arida TaxID=587909 RepID=A0A1I5MPF9_9PSEU|nr:type 1 glutamine amidotransferase [Amycolatopsis arida]TDX94154.1 GMP synthase-like glutamine amidotransferase [Amycolatopsis arida]SFP11439.1 GMP synthase-Glutamine amidotransferase [Amycolatopsis arida]